MRFVDTNVLLYAFSDDAREARKAAVAFDLLGSPDLAVSVQILQEFYVQATRATCPSPMTHEHAAGLLGSFILQFPVAETTVSLTSAALACSQRYQISYWDAAVIEAARALGCDTVLTEDLNHGQDYGGIRVENPFREIR